MFSCATEREKGLESVPNFVYYPTDVVALSHLQAQTFVVPDSEESLDLEHLLL